MDTLKFDSKFESKSGLRHECGVFAAILAGDWSEQNPLAVANYLYLGLLALQHRGQESAGIVTSEGTSSLSFNERKGMGFIGNVFGGDRLQNLRGYCGIGHTRYSTSAASVEVNCQPFVVHTLQGAMAVAHNGELINSDSLRQMVCGRGVGLSTHSDSELITQALCLNPPEGEIAGPDFPARIRHLMQLTPLSYSLVILMRDRIYAVRDPYGNRPLCLGYLKKTVAGGGGGSDQKYGGWVVSSESCSFPQVGAVYMREVRAGEILEMTSNGVRTIDIVERPANRQQTAFCIFEYIYFARPDSVFEGQQVYAVRKQCGKQLAIESRIDADIVSSIPESGTAAALGFAEQSAIPFAEVLCRNRYVGRSFIEPSNVLRLNAIAKKFGVLSENVRGKKLILIDDSIVRGNTIKPIIKLLRDAGAREVHLRIACPPLRYPCYMGVNIPTREELIANQMPLADIACHVGADTLEYLSVEGLVCAVRWNIRSETADEQALATVGHCTACLTGRYPENIPAALQW